MQNKLIITLLIIVGICSLSAASYLIFKRVSAIKPSTSNNSSGKSSSVEAADWEPLVKDNSKLSKILSSLIKKYNQPAMAFALFNSKGIISEAIAGSAVFGENKSVNMDSRFHIGSTTKSMTAILIQMLVDEGKLSYNTTLSEALPDISMLEDYRNVTVQDLLLNKAGILAFQQTDLEDPVLVQKLWSEIPSRYANPQKQRKEVSKVVLNLKPVAKPGSKAVYSNVGWAIAGLITETATGKSYEELIADRIFTPLGMSQAKLGKWPASESEPDQPRGHYPSDNGSSPKPQSLTDKYTFPDWMNPSGGVSCTINDYAIYVRENLKGLKGKGKLLNQKGYKNIHSIHITANIKDMYMGVNDEGTLTLGYGWLVLPVENSLLSTADGSGGTFYATIALMPDLDIGFAAFTNCGDGSKAISEAVKLTTGFDWE